MAILNVLICPDKFAGTLTAGEAAEAFANGWTSGRPADEIRLLPMADGGPGTIDVLFRSGWGTARGAEVSGPVGDKVEARWLAGPDDFAVVEAASACGLHLCSDPFRPLEATTHGVGELIAVVLDAGCRRLVVGLGGSGTVDGGSGMACGLGGRLYDRDGQSVDPVPRRLSEVMSVTSVERAPDHVMVAADVTNPLLGEQGAARVFGPQKGATTGDVELLEAGLASLADAVEQSLPGGPWRDREGAGAAGGLGFGLMAWLGAEVRSGAEFVAGAVELDRHIAWADIVVTGEGGLDTQSLYGKVPGYVLGRGTDLDTPVAVVAGRVEASVGSRFRDHEEIGSEGMVDPGPTAEAAASRLAGRI